MIPLGRPLLAAALAAAVTTSLAGQQKPAPPATPRIYIFDNGKLSGLDPKMSGFSREEVKEPDFVGTSYLIVHSDHTANANDFAASTWITQKAERDYMFAPNPQGIIRPAQLWIEHDMATHATLPKAPAYVE